VASALEMVQPKAGGDVLVWKQDAALDTNPVAIV
jgi:hypothetical protein